MNEKNNHLWLDEYFNRYNESIFNRIVYDDLIRIKDIWEGIDRKGKKSYLRVTVVVQLWQAIVPLI